MGFPQPHAAHINARQQNRENPGGRPELRQGQGQAARAEESGIRTVGGECPSQQLLVRAAQLTTHNAQNVKWKSDMPYAMAGWLLFLFHLAALVAFAALALSSYTAASCTAASCCFKAGLLACAALFFVLLLPLPSAANADAPPPATACILPPPASKAPPPFSTFSPLL